MMMIGISEDMAELWEARAEQLGSLPSSGCWMTFRQCRFCRRPSGYPNASKPETIGGVFGYTKPRGWVFGQYCLPIFASPDISICLGLQPSILRPSFGQMKQPDTRPVGWEFAAFRMFQLLCWECWLMVIWDHPPNISQYSSICRRSLWQLWVILWWQPRCSLKLTWGSKVQSTRKFTWKPCGLVIWLCTTDYSSPKKSGNEMKVSICNQSRWKSIENS